LPETKKLTATQITARYHEYLDCFNKKDLTGLEKYLAKDLYFYRFYGIPPFLGRAEMFAFYKEAWSHFNERVSVSEIHFKKMELASTYYFFIATVNTHLQIFKSWINGPYGTYIAGTEKSVTHKILYVLDEVGMITAIM